MPYGPLRVAAIDDDSEYRKSLVKALENEGFEVDDFSNGPEFLNKLAPGKYHLALVDVVMPEMTGIEVVRRLKRIDQDLVAVIVSAHDTVETIVDAIKVGAFDFLPKTFKIEEFRILLQKALREVERNREIAKIRGDILKDSFCGMIGRASEMRKVFELAERIAPRDVTVLITGASGTGKELLARAIHNLSSRRKGPFLPVNCGAIPETLIDAELFGHEKGAFTGANEAREGLIRASDKGTLFLDEIGDLPAPTQLRLLRFLQEREVRPVGSDENYRVDVRVISATNRDLEFMVREEQFRDDLFYRLSVVPIQLPTLAARRDDIPLLVYHFVERACRKYGIDPIHIEVQAMDALISYDWPGNVRELENVVERLVILGTEGKVTLTDLPNNISCHKQKLEGAQIPIGVTLEELEKWYIRKTLERNDGNRTKTSEILDIDRRTLQRRLSKWDEEDQTDG